MNSDGRASDLFCNVLREGFRRPTPSSPQSVLSRPSAFGCWREFAGQSELHGFKGVVQGFVEPLPDLAECRTKRRSAQKTAWRNRHQDTVRVRANARRLKVSSECGVCQKIFHPRKTTQRYCCKTCADAGRRRNVAPDPTALAEQAVVMSEWCQREEERSARQLNRLGRKRLNRSFYADILERNRLSPNLKVAAHTLRLDPDTLRKRLERDPTSILKPLRRYSDHRPVTVPLRLPTNLVTQDGTMPGADCASASS
jgi:hypothetical protein